MIPRRSTYILASVFAASQLELGLSFQPSVGVGNRRAEVSFDRHFALHQAFRNDDTSSKRPRQFDQQSSLSAVSVGQLDSEASFEPPILEFPDLSGFQKVFTTALMVTANTVGASALVLPEIAAKPGFMASTGLFMAAYVINLVSGLVLAEVAIKQYESSGDDVPASFKDFADKSLDSPSAGSIISAISLFTNSCIMAFDLHRAGDVTSSMLDGGVDPTLSMVGFGAVIAALAATQSGETISKIASVTVAALFVSFFGLLAPGLAHVQDPIGALIAPGTSDNLFSALTEAAPIIFMTTIYQNIVPSVTKILDYDRTKSMSAIALGSFLPVCLYLAWCFMCIGGGAAASGSLLTMFSMAAVTGSSIGCVLSLTEEVESIVPDEVASTSTNPSAWSVAGAVGVPMAGAYMLGGGEDFTVALKIAGSYGSPLLYVAIPAAMAWTQREKLKDLPDLVPGGAGVLGSLGAVSLGLMLQELSTDLGSVL